MNDDIRIRAYRAEDLDALIDLFTGSVRQVASRDYSPAQIEAWAPLAVNREQWATRLGSRPTCVAEAGGQIVGFSDLEPDGHIDMLFVHADHQGQGVARALLSHIHARADEQGIGRLFTEASITARGAAGERLVVHVRAAAHGMTAVDLLYHAS
jgi:putative acetyltransferase